MRRIALLFSVILFGWLAIIAREPDMLIYNNGNSLKCIISDITPTYIYYTERENSDDVKRVPVKDVLVIKMADGRKINPEDAASGKAGGSAQQPQVQQQQSSQVYGSAGNTYGSSTGGTYGSATNGTYGTNTNGTYGTNTNGSYGTSVSGMNLKGNSNNASEVTDAMYVTFTAQEPGFLIDPKSKSYHEYILAGDGNGTVLNFRLLSANDMTCSVAPCRKDMDYERSYMVIPAYVKVGDKKYTVTEVDDYAFYKIWEIENIQFPPTLKSIGVRAFYDERNLKSIHLPESVQYIGLEAFSGCGRSEGNFKELYIPKQVSVIGKDAFRNVSDDTSYRGYTQCRVTSLPSFVNLSNCTEYGIDEEAVERYQRFNK